MQLKSPEKIMSSSASNDGESVTGKITKTAHSVNDAVYTSDNDSDSFKSATSTPTSPSRDLTEQSENGDLEHASQKTSDSNNGHEPMETSNDENGLTEKSDDQLLGDGKLSDGSNDSDILDDDLLDEESGDGNRSKDVTLTANSDNSSNDMKDENSLTEKTSAQEMTPASDHESISQPSDKSDAPASDSQAADEIKDEDNVDKPNVGPVVEDSIDNDTALAETADDKPTGASETKSESDSSAPGESMDTTEAGQTQPADESTAHSKSSDQSGSAPLASSSKISADGESTQAPSVEPSVSEVDITGLSDQTSESDSRTVSADSSLAEDKPVSSESAADGGKSTVTGDESTLHKDVDDPDKNVADQNKPPEGEKEGPKPPQDVKKAFNIISSGPNAQDIKDGHAYLRPMPKFLYQLGLSLMREVVYEGLSKHVAESRDKGEKKYSADQHKSLHKSLQSLKKENKDMKLNYNKVCRIYIDGRKCGFRTESQVALETHLNTTHFNSLHRYVCARCENHTNHIPTDFRMHMLKKHGQRAIVWKSPGLRACKLCMYDTNAGENRLENHMVNCVRHFRPERNLAPENWHKTPLEENIFKITGPPPLVAQRAPATKAHLSPAVVAKPTGNQGQIVLHPVPVTTKPADPKPPMKSPILLQQKLPQNQTRLVSVAMQQPDVCQCEICGGFIQGLQAMKVHMQWSHNINITHLTKPEMSCMNQGCLRVFYTVQGLAKHSRGCTVQQSFVRIPVTDHKVCFICIEKYATTQVEHILVKHLPQLKRMVEARCCLSPLCQPNVIYKDVGSLQNHFAMVHRVKLTGLAGLTVSNINQIKFQPFCSICKMKFEHSSDFAKHCSDKHVHICDLCGTQCSTKLGLNDHMFAMHPFRWCLICNKPSARKYFHSHLQKMHNTHLSQLTLKRMSSEEYENYSKKPKVEGWWPGEEEKTTPEEKTNPPESKGTDAPVSQTRDVTGKDVQKVESGPCADSDVPPVDSSAAAPAKTDADKEVKTSTAESEEKQNTAAKTEGGDGDKTGSGDGDNQAKEDQSMSKQLGNSEKENLSGEDESMDVDIQ